MTVNRQEGEGEREGESRALKMVGAKNCDVIMLYSLNFKLKVVILCIIIWIFILILNHCFEMKNLFRSVNCKTSQNLKFACSRIKSWYKISFFASHISPHMSLPIIHLQKMLLDIFEVTL